jgi:hypothetical protein
MFKVARQVVVGLPYSKLHSKSSLDFHSQNRAQALVQNLLAILPSVPDSADKTSLGNMMIFELFPFDSS